MADLEGQLDLFAAKAARDAALARVDAHGVPWSEQALQALQRLPAGATGTSEEFRAMLLFAGLPKPHHHNAWGAFAMKAVRAGMLVPTGRWLAMRGPKSHARKTPEYRKA